MIVQHMCFVANCCIALLQDVKTRRVTDRQEVMIDGYVVLEISCAGMVLHFAALQSTTLPL